MSAGIFGLATLTLNLTLLLSALGAIALVVFLFFMVKKYVWKIVVNSVLGVVALFVLQLFGISLPFWPSMGVAVIFGLAGIAVELLLYFAGVL